MVRIHIISSLGVLLLNDLPWPSHIIHIHFGIALFALKIQFHILLNADSANHIIEVVFFILLGEIFTLFIFFLSPLLIQSVYLFFLNLSRISDNGEKYRLSLYTRI